MKNMIVNGGDPLGDCPTNWDDANNWIDKANENQDYQCPEWSFDCGFKLDFDGPILSLSSRFYPPKTHYGPMWDGDVTIYLFGEEISRKPFKANTIDELKELLEIVR